MEAAHKTHRPHIKVGKDEEKKKYVYFVPRADRALDVCACKVYTADCGPVLG